MDFKIFEEFMNKEVLKLTSYESIQDEYRDLEAEVKDFKDSKDFKDTSRTIVEGWLCRQSVEQCNGFWGQHHKTFL